MSLTLLAHGLSNCLTCHFPLACFQPPLNMLLLSRYLKASLDQCDLKSFKPLSKLTFLSKVLEKIVTKQLTSFLETHKLYDTFQSAHHYTETALLKVSRDILMSTDAGKCTVLILLDLSAAFDSVNHVILVNGLQDLIDMSGPVLGWFSSYQIGRSFSVSVNH